MSTLSGKSVANTYKDLLTVFDGDQNEGIESSLKTVRDGEGVETAIQLSTTTLKIPSGKTLEIAGTLNSVNATLTGDLNVGDDLTVTDLISGNSLAVTVGSTFGGGYGSTGLSIQSDGDLLMNGNLTTDGTATIAGQTKVGGGYGNTGLTFQSDGDLLMNGNQTVDGTITTGGTIQSGTKLIAQDNVETQSAIVAGSATLGGGYGSTGVTISSTGNIQANGTLTINGESQFGGGYGSTGLTIQTDGDIFTDGNITCNELKTASGTIKSADNDSPKIKFEKDNTDNQVVTTVVDDSGNDADVFTVTEDGVIEVKDKAGTTTFEVKSTGTVKYKSKTTTQLNSITGTPGELVFDSTIGGFKVWES
tara:strand:- start:336 stop:1424 length:1089 start_codon:yes stop_codon:yes gene_type:complete